MRQLTQEAYGTQESNKAATSGSSRAKQMMTEYVNPLKRSLTVRFSQLMPKMPSPMRQKSKKSPKTKEIEEEKSEKPQLDNA